MSWPACRRFRGLVVLAREAAGTTTHKEEDHLIEQISEAHRMSERADESMIHVICYRPRETGTEHVSHPRTA